MGVHGIDSLIFEVGFGSGVAAAGAASELSRFANGPAVDLIARAFDDIAGHDFRLEIDVLEIELPPGLPTATALQEALQVALRRYAAGRSRPIVRAGNTATVSGDLDALWAWLTTGMLSLPGRSTPAAALERLTDRVLALQGPALLKRLRSKPVDVRAVEQIARHWTAPQRAAMLDLLDGTASTPPSATASQWRLALRKATQQPAYGEPAEAAALVGGTPGEPVAVAQPAQAPLTTRPATLLQAGAHSPATLFADAAAAWRSADRTGDRSPWHDVQQRRGYNRSEADLLLDFVAAVAREARAGGHRRDAIDIAIVDLLRLLDRVGSRDLSSALPTAAARPMPADDGLLPRRGSRRSDIANLPKPAAAVATHPTVDLSRPEYDDRVGAGSHLSANPVPALAPTTTANARHEARAGEPANRAPLTNAGKMMATGSASVFTPASRAPAAPASENLGEVRRTAGDFEVRSRRPIPSETLNPVEPRSDEVAAEAKRSGFPTDAGLDVVPHRRDPKRASESIAITTAGLLHEHGADLAGAMAALEQRVVADWPLGSRTRLQSMLATTAVLPADAAAGTGASWRRAELAAQLATGSWSLALWQSAVVEDAAWLAAQLRRQGASSAAWRAQLVAQLGRQQFFELISLWLPRHDATILDELIPSLVAATGTPRSNGLSALRATILAVLLCSTRSTVAVGTVFEALIAVITTDDVDAVAAVAQITSALSATDPANYATTALLRLANAVPPGPLSPDWLKGLPQPLPPLLAHSIVAAIYPGRERFKHFAALDDAARRDLLVRVAPLTAPAALSQQDEQAKLFEALLPPSALTDWRLLFETIADGKIFRAKEFVRRWRAGARAALQDVPALAERPLIIKDRDALRAMLQLWGAGSSEAALLIDLIAAVSQDSADPNGAPLKAGGALFDHLIARTAGVDVHAAAAKIVAETFGSTAGLATAVVSWPAAMRIHLASLLRPTPTIVANETDRARRDGLTAKLARGAWPGPTGSVSERDGPWLVEQLRRYKTDEQWCKRFAGQLRGSLLHEFLALWLSGRDVATLAMVVETLAMSDLSPDAERSILVERLVTAMLLAPGVPPLRALVTALVAAQAENESALPIIVAGRLKAVVPEGLYSRLLQQLPEVRQIKQPPRAAAISGTALSAAAGLAVMPPGSFTPAWLNSLRLPLAGSLIATITAALADPASNLGRLAQLNEADRRRLIETLAPTEAPVALASLDLLSAEALTAGLAATDIPNGFAWRLLLESLFVQRQFDLAKFTAHWSRALDGAIRRSALSSPRPPPLPFSPEWLALQPTRLAPAERAGLLTLAAEDLSRLDHLEEADLRVLLALLAPWHVQAALTIADAASAMCGRAGLSAVSTAGFSRRFLLADLVLAVRPFEASDFTTRWFAGRLAADRGAAQMLAALPTASGTSAGVDHGLLVAALGQALRMTMAVPAMASVAAAVMTPIDAQNGVGVANAGLVLAGVYLPTLFRRLELVAGDAFVSEDAAARGVHVLQYLAEETGPAPKSTLALNKLLCGLDLNTPVASDFEPTDAERAAIDGLLGAMIARWTIIGSTSIAGLRSSFLQRRGNLTLEAECWRLSVEPRTFDMLLDQLPWGFKTQKFAWMKQVLHVDWR